MMSTKNIKQQTLIIILEQQMSILEWFLKDLVTEDWRNDAESSVLPWKE